MRLGISMPIELQQNVEMLQSQRLLQKSSETLSLFPRLKASTATPLELVLLLRRGFLLK